MSTVVRQVKEDDLDGVLALYKELRPNDPALTSQLAHKTFANLLQAPNVSLIVCECGGILTATCMLAVIPNLASGGNPFGVIEHVVTLAQFRRRGHARLALQYALELAWSRHCYKVMLLSGAKRTEAHKLYESVGFVAGIESGFVVKSPSAA
jgi:GNAT superfamily N-acetyltransferase